MAKKPKPGDTANCDRCQKQLRVAATRSEHSAPFRRSLVPKGLCADCAMTMFLYNTYPVNMLIDEAGPEMLLNAEFMRMAFTNAGILKNCEMDIREVDWPRLVENWKLPVKITRDDRNPYRMGDSPRAGKGRDGKLPPLGFVRGPTDYLPPGVQMRSSDSLVIVGGKAFRDGRAAGKGGELGDAIGGLLDAIDGSVQ